MLWASRNKIRNKICLQAESKTRVKTFILEINCNLEKRGVKTFVEDICLGVSCNLICKDVKIVIYCGIKINRSSSI